jgi:hypothetical protein
MELSVFEEHLYLPCRTGSHTLYTYSQFSLCWLFGKDQSLYWFSVTYTGFFSGRSFSQEFFSGAVQQIELRTEGKENGDLGAVAPYSGVPLNLEMSETRILIGLLWIYFPWIAEFVSASEFRGGGGV